MKSFFKPEDFGHLDTREDHARMANAKLEREGCRIFGNDNLAWGVSHEWNRMQNNSHTFQAYLINITPLNEVKLESIEKKPSYEEIEQININLNNANKAYGIELDKVKAELFVLKTKREMDKAHKKMIENLNKEPCTHPAEKVSEIQDRIPNNRRIELLTYYQCECGARVKPTGFEEDT